MAGSSVPCCSPFKHGCICIVFSCSQVFSIKKCRLSLGLLWLPGLCQRLSMPWPVLLCAIRRESSFGCHLLISLRLRAEKRGALLIMILTPATAHALIACCKWLIPSESALKCWLLHSPPLRVRDFMPPLEVSQDFLAVESGSSFRSQGFSVCCFFQQYVCSSLGRQGLKGRVSIKGKVSEFLQ